MVEVERAQALRRIRGELTQTIEALRQNAYGSAFSFGIAIEHILRAIDEIDAELLSSRADSHT